MIVGVVMAAGGSSFEKRVADYQEFVLLEGSTFLKALPS
jgi:hypothetical protein